MEQTELNTPVKKLRFKKKAVVLREECVACGSCVSVCPRDAITIYKGIYAVVEESLCIGCTKCKTTCPASVISMKEVQE